MLTGYCIPGSLGCGCFSHCDRCGHAADLAMVKLGSARDAGEKPAATRPVYARIEDVPPKLIDAYRAGRYTFSPPSGPCFACLEVDWINYVTFAKDVTF
jgi:hypothetical protein